MAKITVMSESDMHNLLQTGFGQNVKIIHTTRDVSSVTGSESIREVSHEDAFVYVLTKTPHWQIPDSGYYEQKEATIMSPARYSVKRDDYVIYKNRRYRVKDVRDIYGVFDNVNGTSEKTYQKCTIYLEGEEEEIIPPHVSPGHLYEIKYGLGTYNSGNFAKVAGSEQTYEGRFDLANVVFPPTTASGQVVYFTLPAERKFVSTTNHLSLIREDQFLRVSGTRTYYTTISLRANNVYSMQIRTYPQDPDNDPDDNDQATLTSIPDLTSYRYRSGTLQAGGRFLVVDNFPEISWNRASYGKHVYFLTTLSSNLVTSQKHYYFEIPDGMTLLQIKLNNNEENLSEWTEVPGSIGYTRYYRNALGLANGTRIVVHAYVGNVPSRIPIPSLDNNDWVLTYGASDNNGNPIEESKNELVIDGNDTGVIQFPYVSNARPNLWFKLPEGRLLRRLRYAGLSYGPTYVRKSGTREFYTTAPFRLTQTPNLRLSLVINTRTSFASKEYVAPENDVNPAPEGWFKIKYGAASRTGELSKDVKQLNFQNYRLPTLFMPTNSSEYPTYYFEIPSDYELNAVRRTFISQDVTSRWIKIHEDNKIKRYVDHTTRYRVPSFGTGIRPEISPPSNQ